MLESKALGVTANKEKTFQGQRFDDDLDLNWMQFKWRNHDPQIGRFIEIDPLSEKYEYNSTYAFSENNVTTHVELEGLEKALANSGFAATAMYATQTASGQKTMPTLKPLGNSEGALKGTLRNYTNSTSDVRPAVAYGFIEKGISTAKSIAVAFSFVFNSGEALNPHSDLGQEQRAMISSTKNLLDQSAMCGNSISMAVGMNMGADVAETIQNGDAFDISRMAGGIGFDVATTIGGMRGFATTEMAASTGGNLGNPFKNLTLSQVDEAFQVHVQTGKLQLKFANSETGAKAYLNTQSGYSYNLDPGGMYGKKLELPHIDVNYAKPKPLNISKKKLPVAGGF
jgi:RHS repeat-associated protein